MIIIITLIIVCCGGRRRSWRRRVGAAVLDVCVYGQQDGDKLDVAGGASKAEHRVGILFEKFSQALAHGQLLGRYGRYGFGRRRRR